MASPNHTTTQAAHPAATTTTKGFAQLATTAQVAAGTDNTVAVTPYGLKQAGVGAGTINVTSPLAITAGGAVASNPTISLGTVPVTGGGTGLTAAPSMLVNLASTAAASPLTASPRPGVTGVLPIANGGTGTTTGVAAGAPLPKTDAGVGQWAMSTSTTGQWPAYLKIPSGGTWLYLVFHLGSGYGESGGQYGLSILSDIVAGGTQVKTTDTYYGIVYRIA